MFIRDAWYVAGWSSSFRNELQALTILGEPLVFYRQSDGRPVALEDACPHRKLPLSMGRLTPDSVECGYHGLTFDRRGVCVWAPTQQCNIPKRARVRSYPVLDRYGLLWIWMGNAEAADPALICAIPNFDNPAWGRTPGGAMDIECHYLLITDNLLDPYHVAWVHVSSFAGAGTDAEAPAVDVFDDGVLVWRWMRDQPPPPYYSKLVGFDGNCDRKQHYECRLPAVAINKSVFTPAGTGGDDDALPDSAFINISYNFMTPVDENNTRYFWFQHRNRDPGNSSLSQSMFEGARQAFLEDKAVLTAVHQRMAMSTTPSVTLQLDVGAVRFRLLVNQRLEQQAGRSANSDSVGES